MLQSLEALALDKYALCTVRAYTILLAYNPRDLSPSCSAGKLRPSVEA